jgi:hypothetical protein
MGEIVAIGIFVCLVVSLLGYSMYEYARVKYNKSDEISELTKRLEEATKEIDRWKRNQYPERISTLEAKVGVNLFR